MTNIILATFMLLSAGANAQYIGKNHGQIMADFGNYKLGGVGKSYLTLTNGDLEAVFTFDSTGLCTLFFVEYQYVDWIKKEMSLVASKEGHKYEGKTQQYTSKREEKVDVSTYTLNGVQWDFYDADLQGSRLSDIRYLKGSRVVKPYESPKK